MKTSVSAKLMSLAEPVSTDAVLHEPEMRRNSPFVNGRPTNSAVETPGTSSMFAESMSNRHEQLMLASTPLNHALPSQKGSSNRPQPIYASEQSLPDRLSQALRGLSSSIIPRFHNNSNVAVTANDVVYYASGKPTNSSRTSLTTPTSSSNNTASSQSASSVVVSQTPSTAFAQQQQRRLYERKNSKSSGKKVRENVHRQSLDPQLTTLEQLRQLYSSAPDVSKLDEADPSQMAVQEQPKKQQRPRPPPPAYGSRKLLSPLSQTSGLNGASRKPPPVSTPIYANLYNLENPTGAEKNGALQNGHLAVVTNSNNHSPTDSGYRSVSRHLNCDMASPPGETAEPALSTTVVSVNGTLSMSQPSEALAPPAEHFERTPSPIQQPASGKQRATAIVLVGRTEEAIAHVRVGSAETSKLSQRSGHTKVNLLKSTSVPCFDMMQRHSRENSLQDDRPSSTATDAFALQNCTKLVDLEYVPWSDRDVVAVLQRGRCKSQVQHINVDVVPRLNQLLQRPLVRLALLLRRICAQFSYCAQQHVLDAVKIVLSPSLCSSCTDAALQASSLFSMDESHGGTSFDSWRHSRQQRANVHLSVGNFHRWIVQAAVCRVVNELAVVSLTAVTECILEEMVLRALRSRLDTTGMLTANQLDAHLQSDAEFWGLMQPYAHLITSRTADGCLTLTGSGLALNRSHRGSSSALSQSTASSLSSSTRSGKMTNGSLKVKEQQQQPPILIEPDELEQCMLATCVGGVRELNYLIDRILDRERAMNNGKSTKTSFVWSAEAIEALYHFMRCSQLSHGAVNGPRPPLTLLHERTYSVLPSLADWVRIASGFCGARRSTVIQSDDVRQSAQLLLPNVDCPPACLPLGTVQLESCPVDQPQKRQALARRQVAFDMLRAAQLRNDVSELGEMLPVISGGLGVRRLNTPDAFGLTPLMVAARDGQYLAVRTLVDAGADMNVRVADVHDKEFSPCLLSHFGGASALTFALLSADRGACEQLIQCGADVHFQDGTVENPLQIAAMIGDVALCARLMECGADAFVSTCRSAAEGYSYKLQGAASPIALAAAHGHRQLVQLMLTTADDRGHSDDSLSLADFLAEASGSGAQQGNVRRHRHLPDQRLLPLHNSGGPATNGHTSNGVPDGGYARLGRVHQRALQQAIYYAAENGQLDIAVELRNFGVPWSLYVWTQCFATAYGARRRSLLHLLLVDATTGDRLFDEVTHEFVDDAVPLLMECLHKSKHDAIVHQLAALLNRLFLGPENDTNVTDSDDVDDLRSPTRAGSSFSAGGRSGGGGVDARFVNNSELSDVQFLVDDRLFYAHRIVLVNASPVLHKMLIGDNATNDAQAPITIDDIDYDVFHLMMEFLYSNELMDCSRISFVQLLQLHTAAQRFQIDVLVSLCEVRICRAIDQENAVDIYKFATSNKAVRLQRYCERFFLAHLPMLVDRDGFRRLLQHSARHGDLCSGLVSAVSDRLQRRVTVKA